jgi:hypothetical protein
MMKRREDNMTITRNTTLLWSAVLGLTAALGSYGLACVFPFAAIGALAAVTLPTRQAAGLLAAVWVMNQIVGFTLLSYPHDGQALAWGAFIGVGAAFGLWAAKRAFGTETRLVSWRTLAALAASIVAYQVVMAAGAYVLDGFESSTPAIVADVVRNDVMWFAGLAALRLALGASLPRWFGTPQTA